MRLRAKSGRRMLFAVRGDEDPLIVELKTGFSLSLFHQAIERQQVTDTVYIAVPRGTGKLFVKAVKNNKALCRRLGLGLMTVRMKDGFVEIHIDPAPYNPRQSKRKEDAAFGRVCKSCRRSKHRRCHKARIDDRLPPGRLAVREGPCTRVVR